MIKTTTIVRPAWLEGLYNQTMFIPPNSSDYLVKIDMGFKINPLYQQEKLCLFLPENIYYQQLTLVDGKSNSIKDDARTIVITGEIDHANPIHFIADIFPSLPDRAGVDAEKIMLPVYPEIDTEIIIRDNSTTNVFHHFVCTKMVYRPGLPVFVQLRYINRLPYSNLVTIFRNWHRNEIKTLENIYNIEE